jgi:hypothetical protein
MKSRMAPEYASSLERRHGDAGFYQATVRANFRPIVYNGVAGKAHSSRKSAERKRECRRCDESDRFSW